MSRDCGQLAEATGILGRTIAASPNNAAIRTRDSIPVRFSRVLMPFIDISTIRPIEAVPGCRMRTPFGKNLMLSYLEMDEGAVVPLHSHPHEQGGMLLKGKIELTIGDEKRVCEAGSMFLIPPERAAQGGGRRRAGGRTGRLQSGPRGLRGTLQQVHSDERSARLTARQPAMFFETALDRCLLAEAQSSPFG